MCYATCTIHSHFTRLPKHLSSLREGSNSGKALGRPSARRRRKRDGGGPCSRRLRGPSLVFLGLDAVLSGKMEAAGDDEPEPIKLKSIKNNKTFTVPQSDRVREPARSWVRGRDRSGTPFRTRVVLTTRWCSNATRDTQITCSRV